MRDRFGKEVNELIGKMEASIQAKNQIELTSVFHSIKGVAATLGAVRLAALAADLEAQGRKGEWIPEETIYLLRGVVNQSVSALEQLDFNAERVKVKVTLTSEQLQSLLDQIDSYLAEDNMSAVTLAENLVAVHGDCVEVNTFYEQVESLDFPTARRTLKIVKETLLNGNSHETR
ncbi:hypothetical protein CA267_002670 [Alteromonas pelagimontana]|uniref:HPt domain-containing protein n=1 Tax=Alteromonas pelagimontana TaxID=1858656 RepID=A0A6M4MB36_9ALTE|nr:Hpt domain-containing protein [Alteromonas pelagimontana]QJR79775.1 hypothetical protein CA267_002670 [Alteromonas pelagimontana]